MSINGTQIQRKNLWLELISGSMKTITRSGRFRELIVPHPGLNVIGINKILLGPGLFVGGWKCCPLQLLHLPEKAPEICIRFNSDNAWTIFSINPEVTINDRPIPDLGYILDFGDEIQIASYRFRVVQRPEQEDETRKQSAELEQMMGKSLHADPTTSSDSSSETDFDLNI